MYSEYKSHVLAPDEKIGVAACCGRDADAIVYSFIVSPPWSPEGGVLVESGECRVESVELSLSLTSSLSFIVSVVVIVQDYISGEETSM